MGFNHMKHEPEMRAVLKELKEYSEDIKSLGIHDFEVDKFKLNSLRILGKFFVSLLRLVMSLIFVFPGLISLIPLGIKIK